MAIQISRRRASLALLALALVFPLLLLMPPTVTTAQAADSQFTFEGGGWGHAVGLSQYGAYGMALLEDADAETILTHYYTGVSLKKLGADIPDVEPLWVNLLNGASSALLRPMSISGGGVTVTVTHEGSAFMARPGDAIRAEVIGSRGGDPLCRVTVADAVSEGSCFADLSWDGDLDDPTTRLTIEEFTVGANGPTTPCTNPDWNAIPTVFRPCSYSDGTMHLRPAGPDDLHVLVRVDIEDYVLGTSEMPYFWGNPADGPNGTAALEAQAVASRSYAISRQIARGNPEDTLCWCDVVDTSADQRYVGWGHTGLGSDAWRSAVEATAGIVLTHPAVGNGERAITAYFGSSSYGITESGLDGFAQDVPYLQSVDDRWADDPAVHNTYSPWTFTLTGDDIADRLGLNARTVVSAEVSACSEAGSAVQVRFVDDAGNEHLRASRDLRTSLGLRSPQITAINGVAACGGAPDDTTSPLAAELRVRIRDTGVNDSVGNGDAIAQCGETIELLTSIENQGDSTVTGIEATVRLDDPHVELLHNSTSSFPDIAPGDQEAVSDDWDLRIADVAPDRHVVPVLLDVTADGGIATTLLFEFWIRCEGEDPEFPVMRAAGGIEIDDGVRGDSVGNNDGLAQCGETIELYVALESHFDEPLEDVAARLTFDDPRLTLLHNDASPYPKIKPGGTRTNENDWDIAISEDFDALEIVRMVLIVDAAGETFEFPFGIEVTCFRFTPEISRSIIDDGPTGDSVGNNDGIAQCGETIELSLRLSNFGERPIRDISTTLIAVDPALTLLHNSDAGYADLDGNSGAWNDNDWDLQIGNVPDGYEARYQVLVRFDDGREERHRRSLPVSCANPDPVSVSSVTIDDGVFGDSIGNNNKIAQCGELIELYIELQNLTGSDLDGFEAVLSSDDPALRLLYNSSSPYAAMGPTASGENVNDWDLQVDSGIGDRYTAVVTLTIDALDLSIDVPVRLRCEA